MGLDEIVGYPLYYFYDKRADEECRVEALPAKGGESVFGDIGKEAIRRVVGYKMNFRVHAMRNTSRNAGYGCYGLRQWGTRSGLISTRIRCSCTNGQVPGMAASWP